MIIRNILMARHCDSSTIKHATVHLCFSHLQECFSGYSSSGVSGSCIPLLHTAWSPLKSKKQNRLRLRDKGYLHSQQKLLSDWLNYSHKHLSQPLMCQRSPAPFFLQDTNHGTSAGQRTAESPHREAAPRAKPVETHTWYSHLEEWT